MIEKMTPEERQLMIDTEYKKVCELLSYWASLPAMTAQDVNARLYAWGLYSKARDNYEMLHRAVRKLSLN